MQQGKTITLKIILLIFLDNANIWTQVVQIVGIYKKGTYAFSTSPSKIQ
mgnify:FL=1